MSQTQSISTERDSVLPSLNHDSHELAQAYEEASDRQFNHGKILIDSLHIREGQRVLDVGCGTGRLGEYVADLVGDSGEVVGVDPLPLRIDIASRKHRPNFRTQVGNAEDLSAFADGSFDAIYFNSVFHWVGNKAKALAEAYRVLRKGGRIALNSADTERPHDSKILIAEVLRDEGIADNKVASAGINLTVTNEQLHQLIVGAGFVDYQGQHLSFVDHHPDAAELIRFNRSSFFGNFLLGLTDDELARVHRRLDARLDALRAPGGAQLKRHLVFASAQKP